jgi:hypothetical protein
MASRPTCCRAAAWRCSTSRAAVVYTPARSERVTIPLAGQSQESLLEALLIAMDLRGEGLVQCPDDQWSHTQELLMHLDRLGHPYHPERHSLTETTPLSVNARVAADYGQALYRIA